MHSLHFPLDPQAIQGYLTLGVYGIAGIAIWVSLVPIEWKLSAAILLLAIALLGRHRRRAEVKGEILTYQASAGWAIESPEARSHPLTVLPSTVVTAKVVFLHARVGDLNRAWMLIDTGQDSESFRQLRANLRVAPLSGADGS